MNVRERLLEGVPVTERKLELAGASAAVLEGGRGEPIVLLHGPGEYGAKWLRVVPALVRTHRVVAPDLPGHGESAGVEGVERVLAWLDDLVARTCEAPPSLVGHIVGGAMAARYAARYPRSIARLVLVDTLGLAPFQPAPEFGAALGAFLAQPEGATHDALWSLCAFDLPRLREDFADGWERLRAYNLDRARAPGLAAFGERLMADFGLPAIPGEELAAIEAPTGLIWGRHDLATPLAVAEAASARYRWPLQVIDGAGDDPPIEKPAEFVQALRVALGGASTSAVDISTAARS